MTNAISHTIAGGLKLTRRGTLLGLGAAFSLGKTSFALAQADTDARLVVLNIRGGLDGLSLVAPYGDPNLAKLRSLLMAPPVGQPGGMLDLGGFYGLHPAMPNLHAMYRAGEAAMVHAVGNSAATRSHFDGQDYLQSGAPTLMTSGWLNRAVGLMPQTQGAVQTGILVDANTPLLLRGPATVAGWAPDPFSRPSPALQASLLSLTQNDPLIGPALAVGYQDRAIFAALQQQGPTPSPDLSSLANLAWSAGEFLAAANGPRVAALETAAFDTHADQVNRLNTDLPDIDQALLALKITLGNAWANTVVVTMTEFGRTAAANGASNIGTDHGTGFAIILAGGAVAGGRVVANWPGLSSTQLFQGRDLAPTVDFRAIVMGVLQQHMGMSPSAMNTVFPNAGVQAFTGLVS